jgi:hypothetical protein
MGESLGLWERGADETDLTFHGDGRLGNLVAAITLLSRLTADGVESAMQNPTANRSVTTDETNRLIASHKVEGTAVYNRAGERSWRSP